LRNYFGSPPEFYSDPKLLHFAPKVPIFDKRKTPQIIDLQRFVDFELWFKWCHQEHNGSALKSVITFK
jgi:hypothetical protein